MLVFLCVFSSKENKTQNQTQNQTFPQPSICKHQTAPAFLHAQRSPSSSRLNIKHLPLGLYRAVICIKIKPYPLRNTLLPIGCLIISFNPCTPCNTQRRPQAALFFICSSAIDPQALLQL